MNFAVVRNADTFWGKIVASELACMGRNLILLGRRTDVLRLLSEDLAGAHSISPVRMFTDEADALIVQLVCDVINDEYPVDLLVNLNVSLLAESFDEVDIWSLRKANRLGFQAGMEFTHQLLPNLQQYGNAAVVNLAVEASIPTSLDTVFQAARSEFHQLVHREVSIKSNRSEILLPWTTADMEQTMVVYALRNQIRETLEVLLNPGRCVGAMNPTL